MNKTHNTYLKMKSNFMSKEKQKDDQITCKDEKKHVETLQ